MHKKRIIAGFLLAVLIWVTGTNESLAQRAQLYLDLQLSQSMANSQVINLTKLLSTRRKGPTLFNLFIQNENATEAARDLYFGIRIHSGKGGLILHMYQKQGQPFSLKPGQQVYATNNDLKNGLPGVNERIEFDGGLTSEGEELINKMGGSTKLPRDQYTIQVDIFQGNNHRNGGVWIASVEAEMGSNVLDDESDIYLTSPGDVLGSDVVITNPYPEFRWEGSAGTDYRLIVVEARGQESPESLLQGALSTEPNRGRGNGNNVSFLDYEILDISLKKPSFQFPPSGVQSLEPGKIYYWQVLTELTTSSGTETRSSEIWTFSMSEEGSEQTLQANSELGRVLRRLLGNTQFQQLRRNGFRLQSVVIDGEVVTGPLVLQRLVELQDKLDQGEISIEMD